MITEAINSFRGQIDNDFEVLVLDNGSPAETERLKRSLGRASLARIRCAFEASPRDQFRLTKPDLAAGEGRYICVVDDDDIALPNRLADHLKVFSRRPQRSRLARRLDRLRRIDRRHRTQPGEAEANCDPAKGHWKNPAHPASFYRADVMRAVPYDESFALWSDFDFALRLANNGFEVAHSNSYLTLRRYHSANVTITGQVSQVSNGASARSRTLGSLDWQRLGGLDDEAKSHNEEVYCRNQMSIDSIADLIRVIPVSGRFTYRYRS